MARIWQKYRKSVRNGLLIGLTYKSNKRRYEMPFYTYITTNPGRTTLYIGMTNELGERLKEHYENRGDPETFAGRYYCYKLIYYKAYRTAQKAIEREKELKKWRREKKEALIEEMNPDWKFLNYIDDFRVGRM